MLSNDTVTVKQPVLHWKINEGKNNAYGGRESN